MKNNELKNIIKTIKVDTKDEDFPDFNKIDPGFAEVIKNYYKENQVKPSKESYQKAMQMAREHKRMLETSTDGTWKSRIKGWLKSVKMKVMGS